MVMLARSKRVFVPAYGQFGDVIGFARPDDLADNDLPKSVDIYIVKLDRREGSHIHAILPVWADDCQEV